MNTEFSVFIFFLVFIVLVNGGVEKLTEHKACVMFDGSSIKCVRVRRFEMTSVVSNRRLRKGCKYYTCSWVQENSWACVIDILC